MMEGFRTKTNEEKASEELYDFFADQGKVHCWHPPDGKAYFTLLLQVPQLNSKGKRKGSRDHIDLIVQIGSTLLLLEVKGKLSESDVDIEKLRNINNSYSISELVTLFKNQGAKFEVEPNELIIGIAARVIDCEIPIDFAVFGAGDGEVTWYGEIANSFMKK